MTGPRWPTASEDSRDCMQNDPASQAQVLLKRTLTHTHTHTRLDRIWNFLSWLEIMMGIAAWWPTPGGCTPTPASISCPVAGNWFSSLQHRQSETLRQEVLARTGDRWCPTFPKVFIFSPSEPFEKGTFKTESRVQDVPGMSRKSKVFHILAILRW